MSRGLGWHTRKTLVSRVERDVAPTSGDYRYTVGTLWVDRVGGEIYHLKSVVGTTATWTNEGEAGEVFVSDEWYTEISSGTTGTLAAPANSTFVLDSWAEDVDAVVSTISAGTRPDIEHAREADGTIITTTFNSSGDYTLSGTPSSYPVAIIFRYRVKFKDYDNTKSLNAFVLHDGLIAYDTISIPAGAMIPSTTDGAATGTYETTTNKNVADYFAFDSGATEESIQFNWKMPFDWDGGTVKFLFDWSSDTGSTTGDTVEIGVSGVAINNSDARDVAQGTPQVISDALLADSGDDNQVTEATPAVTIAGSPTTGSWVNFRIYRNTDGTDDMAEKMWLLNADMQYRKNTQQVAR